jgi:alkylation response protein AidB-like acyl-CoA dehydrogenase
VVEVDLEFSEEQELLRSAVAGFLAARAPVGGFVRPMLEDPRGTTHEVHEGLAGLGVFGLLVPEAAGGAGAGMTEAGVVAEELGRLVHPGPWLGAAVGAATVLVGTGGHDRLGDLAVGAWLPTLAVHEPGRRYAWHSPATTAAPEESGPRWRLTGAKRHVLDGAAADAFVVVAAAPDGLGAFLVDAAADGVSTTVEDSVDGTRTTVRLDLDHASAQRLGADRPADADVASVVAAAVDLVGVALVLDGVGAAQAALDMARTYALERVQFDRPVAGFQAVQHLLVDILTDLELTRAGAYYALWAADRADQVERHRAASLAKAQACHVLARIGADALQVFAGVGFTWEHDIHLFYKRLVGVTHLYGDEDHHLDELAGLVLDRTEPEAV